ncbi:hypothetical protein EJB05_13365 [Eragrostis curvula]|uniref:Uncharacterized protein n=1 Tax=Eragrostis curvula TaxID=38414 RepID=A0A5J9VWA6_9POAL|nr:hypothetical protein EJB05_13365 [Eragrostis curvula]
MKMLGEDPPGLPESPPAPAPAWTAGIRQVRPVLPQLRPAGLVVVDSVLHRIVHQMNLCSIDHCPSYIKKSEGA